MKSSLFLFGGLVFYLSCGPTSPQPAPHDEEDLKEFVSASVRELEAETDTTGGLINPGLFTYPTFSQLDSVLESEDTDTAAVRLGEAGWVQVTETRLFSNAVAPDRARQELLQILRNQAVSAKVPTNVEVTTLLTDVMSEVDGVAEEQTAWSGFFRSTVSGVVTNEKILEDTMIPIPHKNSYEKKVVLRAYVEPVRGQRDPGFYVEAELGNNLLKEGEELTLWVKTSQDCYLYVFNLLADHNALLMFPNDYMKNNRLKGGESLQIPAPEIRDYVKFVVGTLPGRKLTTESIYLVCTKDPVPVIEDFPTVGTTLQLIPGNSASFMKLQRWLTNIPLNRRVERNLIYHVVP